ncbi:HU family DNA-binding protein [Nonomuraea sp. NPDC050790]|uniref:HU family DNA-binding protein n=1 Tax=Nonomuraea sp. NPDC050790 TaxID=3364371 RepID=UPI0037A81C5A
MNKKLLIDSIAATTGLPKKTVTEVVDAFLGSVQESVAAGNKVSIIGFGSFVLRHSPAREARNPSTGATVQVPEKWTPKFQPGSGFVGLCIETQGGAK